MSIRVEGWGLRVGKEKKWPFLFLLLSLPSTLNPQPNLYAASESVKVTAQAFPSKATIGDEIRLVVDVERPKKWMVDTPSQKLKLDPFEVKRVEVSPVKRGQ